MANNSTGQKRAQWIQKGRLEEIHSAHAKGSTDEFSSLATEGDLCKLWEMGV